MITINLHRRLNRLIRTQGICLLCAAGLTSAPVLDLDLTTALDSRITFTRASSGTYFDSAGVMQTATTNTPRFNYEYNGSSWVAKGLLIEPAATNLALYSSTHSGAQLGTAAGTTPPTITGTTYGGVSVEAITFPAVAAGYANSRRTGGGSQAGSWTSVSGTTYTTSAYIALSRPLTGSEAITIYQTGAIAGPTTAVLNSSTTNPTVLQRYSGSGSVGASGGMGTHAFVSGTLLSPVTVYITRFQLEAGSVATSFIETTSSTVTRAADVASITGTNFSSWFNPAEFTAVIEFSPRGACPSTTTQKLLSFSDGTSSNKVLLYRSNTTTSLQVRSGGSADAQLDGAVLAALQTHKIAISVKANSFRMVANGGTVLSDTSGAMPSSMSQMGIGYDVTAPTDIANSEVARVTFYPSGSFTDANLQSLTS